MAFQIFQNGPTGNICDLYIYVKVIGILPLPCTKMRYLSIDVTAFEGNWYPTIALGGDDWKKM